MSKHHETMAPSSWGRVDRCPGSVALSAKMPDLDEAGPGAKRGTILHAAALEGVGAEDLNEFDRRAVDLYRDFVADTMRKHGDDEEWKNYEGLKDEGLVPGWETFIEETLLIWGKDGLASFGTADEIWVPMRQDLTAAYGCLPGIQIFDLKTHPTGEMPEHSLTCQGIAYAVGALQRWKTAPSATFTAFAPYGGREGASYSFTVTRDEMPGYEKWVDGMVAKVDQAMKADPDTLFKTLNPGPEQCKYCRAAGICPAIREVNTEVQRGLVERQGLPPGMHATTSGTLEVHDQRMLAEFYNKMEVAQRALDAAKTHLKTLLAETDSEFLELRERSGRRTFVTEPRHKSDLPSRVARALRKEDYLEATTVSISRLRKVFSERYAEKKGCTKAGAGLIFDQVMEEAIAKGDPAFSIAWRKGAKRLLEAPKDDN